MNQQEAMAALALTIAEQAIKINALELEAVELRQQNAALIEQVTATNGHVLVGQD